MTVVRKDCRYQPFNFRFLVPNPCKTAKFSNQLNVFPMSPVFVTAPFLVQKALKTTNSEKCVFSFPASKVVPGPPNSLVFLRKPAPGVRRAPKSVFCPEKPANSSPLSSSPLVTALSPLAFWVQKCAKPGPVPKLLLRRVFSRPGVLHVTRQPAELVTARRSHLTIGFCYRPKTALFGPKTLSPRCHRFVTALFAAEKCAKARGLGSWQV